MNTWIVVDVNSEKVKIHPNLVSAPHAAVLAHALLETEGCTGVIMVREDRAQEDLPEDIYALYLKAEKDKTDD